MPQLLAIDDDPAILECYRMVFRESAWQLLTAATAAEGLKRARREKPDVILLDIDLPDRSGLETFRELRQLDPRILVIFITGQGTTETAIQAMSLGAFDYLLKPVQLEPLREVTSRAFEVSRLMSVPVVVAAAERAPERADVLLGRCPAMQAVYKEIGRVAPQDVTVLILGESGTGKELAARAIYHYSKRADKPFLAINCAAIPETLLESELFGHEKGAFTGADRRRIGKFEQCSGGTLFLDEIGDMTPLTQSKILRVIQDQQFERVGGNETIRTDVRLIAATHRDLEERVASGQFRADLFYRINVFTVRLPPLRERGDDLAILVEHFLKRFNPILDKAVHTVPEETLGLLRRHSWPGNIRELQSILKQALLHATGSVLLPEFLPPSFTALGTPSGPARLPSSDLEQFVLDRLQAGSQDVYAEWIARQEREFLPLILRYAKNNISQAARILGIHRSTLKSKLDALGMRDQSSE